MAKNRYTGERLETSCEGRDMIDHLHRYSMASNYVKDLVVLDIACGEGYGSNILSQTAKHVYGVDIDSETITCAQKKYVKSNISFKIGSTDSIPMEDNSIDVVVSFETIEHHDRHEEMMKEISRVLKPDGLLIISTPDKLYYSDLRGFINKFHVKELYKEEFNFLIKSFFKNTQFLNQMYVNYSSIIIDNNDSEKIELFDGDYSNIRVLKKDLTYLIAIASNVEFQKQNFSVFDGVPLLINKNNEMHKNFKSSTTWKIGSFFMIPYLKIRKIFE